VATDFSAEIERLRHTYASIAAVTDPEALRARIAELSEQASAPDLWDDPDSAQVVTSALSHAQADLKRVESLGERIEDLEAMVELAGEEEGEDAAEILAEAETDLAAISKDLSDLEIRTLLSGEYDPRDAVITIRSGAGGVDAADFAEMLLRMYTRWAERHDYPVKVLNTSYAEEAGLKSVTFEVHAPYAYGTLSVEGGTHRLVRISPFDNQGRRQTSFAAVEVIPLIESTDHIDVPEMLACVDYVAAPPVRPAPEYLSRATRAYYAPVDDFELMVTTVVAADGRLPVPGRGPRILLAVEGAMTLVTQADTQTLAQGEAVFVGADERSLSVEGEGTLVQADVP